jgi:hypothetical protein
LSESDTDRSLPAKDNFLKIPEPIEVKKEVSPPKIEVKTVKVEFHDEVNPFNFVIKEVKPEKLPEPPVELPEANDSFGFWKPQTELNGLDYLLDPNYAIDEAFLMQGSKEAMSILENLDSLIDSRINKIQTEKRILQRV